MAHQQAVAVGAAFTTPVKAEPKIEYTTPITYNEMLFGVETEVVLETPEFGKQKDVPQSVRKTKGGKTITVYDEIDVQDEEIDIEGDFIPNNQPKKRKSSSSKPKQRFISYIFLFDSVLLIFSTQKIRGAKKSRSRISPGEKSDNSGSLVYNILTQLDTPPTKAACLEKNISKVFMGEEILKMQKNSEEEDEEIDIV